MSTQNTTRGRSLEQKTHDGSSSIGTMGSGGTGNRSKPASDCGNSQSAGRTDDLLSGGCEEEERAHGFQTGTQYQQGAPEQERSKPK